MFVNSHIPIMQYQRYRIHSFTTNKPHSLSTVIMGFFQWVHSFPKGVIVPQGVMSHYRLVASFTCAPNLEEWIQSQLRQVSCFVRQAKIIPWSCSIYNINLHVSSLLRSPGTSLPTQPWRDKRGIIKLPCNKMSCSHATHHCILHSLNYS